MLEQSATKTIYIAERGVLGWETIFGEWKQWPNLSVAWWHNNTPHKAQTLTYFIGPILAGLTRRWRAKQFCKLLAQYEGWRIILVAHSEGTATGLLALKLAHYPPVEEIHLVCGACNADYGRNGLNHAVALNRAKKIFIYIAGKDKAMKLEDTYLGSLCFGLQCGGTPMGLRGPENMTPEAARRTTIRKWPTFGHSDCFTPFHFDDTMLEITYPIAS